MRAGDFDAAAETFSEVIAAEKYLPEAYRGKGLCELFLGDYADAAVSLQKSIYHTTNEDEQFQRDVKIYLAYCRERQGKPDEAMEIYNELIMKQPDSEVLFLRGRFCTECLSCLFPPYFPGMKKSHPRKCWDRTESCGATRLDVKTSSLAYIHMQAF